MARSGTDKDVVKDAMDCFSQLADEENEQRNLMRADYEFRALKQWDENLRAAREGDIHGARPCLVFDRTNQHVRQVVNDGRLNRPGMRVRPVDDEADPKTAEMLNGLIRHIEQKSSSKADIAYDWALECAATAGLGWFRITTEVIDRQGNQEPCIKRIANPLSIYAGTAWTEPDGCDIQELFVTADMSRKEFKRKYPKADPCSVQDALGDEVEWVSRDTVRIAEWFRIEESKENRILTRDGGDMGETAYWDQYSGNINRPEVSGSYEKLNRVVRWRKISAKETLDETVFPASYIPVIPTIGQEIWIGNKRILFGMVRPAMDPQRMYNLARSNFAEHVTMSPRAKWLMAEGQDENHEQEWKDAHRSSNPVLRYKATIDGQPAQPPSRIFGPEVPQGLSADMALSERDLQAAMGQYGPSLGAPSNERSGVAIREKKSEGDRGNFHYIDNLGRSIRAGCTITVEMIQRTYDVPRAIRILGEDGKPSAVEVNPEAPQSYAAHEQQDGSVREVFNPSVGHYDVIPASGPAYPTLRAEAAAAMIQIVQANPAILQTHGDLIFESQDWPDAERFAKRFKALLPPQIAEAEAADQQGKPLDPEAVAAVMQREHQIQQMGAQMEQMAKAMQALQQKAQSNDAAMLKERVEAAKLELEQKKLSLDVFNAETDRMKAVAEIDLRAAQADKADSEANKVDAETHNIRTGTAKRNEDGSWSLSMGNETQH